MICTSEQPEGIRTLVPTVPGKLSKNVHAQCACLSLCFFLGIGSWDCPYTVDLCKVGTHDPRIRSHLHQRLVVHVRDVHPCGLKCALHQLMFGDSPRCQLA